MSAPLGNQFWKLRSKHGRDKLFVSPELLWEAACEYFQWCDENPFFESEQRKGNIIVPKGVVLEDIDLSPVVELPKMRPYTIHGLCLFLGVNTKYFNDFKAANHEGFSEVLTRMDDVIYNQKFSGAAAGFLNPNIIARDLGLSDKKELDHKGIPEPTFEVVIKKPDE